MLNTLRKLAPLPLLALSLESAAAQEVLYSIEGDSPDERCGMAVSGVGDLNGDGHDDFIVGAAQDPTNGSQAGEVRVFSGVDGSEMFRILGTSPGGLFGNAVSGAGDVNLDGTPDFIVGAVWEANDTGPFAGSASIFSGVDGSLLHKLEGSADDFFGIRVSGMGDVNSDGHADVIELLLMPEANVAANKARVDDGRTRGIRAALSRRRAALQVLIPEGPVPAGAVEH